MKSNFPINRTHPRGAHPPTSKATFAPGRWQTTLAALSLLFTGMAQAAIVTVVTDADSGPGSFRQAILDANANPGADTINFNIPGAGVHTIKPGPMSLPAITDTVTINGYNQADSTSRTEIDGEFARNEVIVDDTVYISVMGDFGSGSVSGPLEVLLDPSGELSLACNADALPSGSLAGKIALILRGVCNFSTKIRYAQAAGAIGVIVVQHSGFTDEPTGMGQDGTPNQPTIPTVMVSVDAGAELMTKSGAQATLTAYLLNGLTLISTAPDSVIKGLVINNAAENGIEVFSVGSTISKNCIGTDATGTAARPNGESGIRLRSGGNIVGGLGNGEGNIIAFNRLNGVSVDGESAKRGVAF